MDAKYDFLGIHVYRYDVITTVGVKFLKRIMNGHHRSFKNRSWVNRGNTVDEANTKQAKNCLLVILGDRYDVVAPYAVHWPLWYHLTGPADIG